MFIENKSYSLENSKEQMYFDDYINNETWVFYFCDLSAFKKMKKQM